MSPLNFVHLVILGCYNFNVSMLQIVNSSQIGQTFFSVFTKCYYYLDKYFLQQEDLKIQGDANAIV